MQDLHLLGRGDTADGDWEIQHPTSNPNIHDLLT